MIKKKKINKAFSERHKKLHEIQILMSVNKTLLKHSHAYSFTYCPWQLPNHSGEVFHQRLMAHKASTVYDLALHRKKCGSRVIFISTSQPESKTNPGGRRAGEGHVLRSGLSPEYTCV